MLYEVITERLLRRMTDYMASLQQFSVATQNTLEAVLASGQKIQFVMNASVTVQRSYNFV